MIRGRLGAIALAATLTAALAGACSGDDGPSSPTSVPVSGGSTPNTNSPNTGPSGCTPPAAPANLRVTLKTQSLVELSWNAAPGATSYTLLVGTTAAGTDIMRADMTHTSFRFAAPDGRQYARVQAHASCGAGPISGALEYSVP